MNTDHIIKMKNKAWAKQNKTKKKDWKNVR